VAAVSQLTVTGAELARGLDLLDIGTGANGLEEVDGGGGLGDGGAGEGGRGNDKWDLWDGGDAVTAGEEKGGGGRGGESGGSSEALLSEVDLLVPLSPDLGRGEHATGTALVTKGGLTSTVSTTTRDTRNTCDGTT